MRQLTLFPRYAYRGFPTAGAVASHCAAVSAVGDYPHHHEHGRDHFDRRGSRFFRPWRATTGTGGAMISSGRTYMMECWWVVTIPGLAILINSPRRLTSWETAYVTSSILAANNAPLLDVRNLHVDFVNGGAITHAVRGVSLPSVRRNWRLSASRVPASPPSGARCCVCIQPKRAFARMPCSLAMWIC